MSFPGLASLVLFGLAEPSLNVKWSLLGLPSVVLALIGAPLMLGIVNKVKAYFGGRVGPPVLQPYYNLSKWFGKGAVYSRTTTWIFRAAPLLALACTLLTLLLLPFGGMPALISFPGDLILFAYLLGACRFVMVLAALDTGSAFEGMGASREVFFSAMAEPSLLLALAAIARETETYSLTQMHERISFLAWTDAAVILALVTVVLVIVFLTETSRVPVDDPNTHLELTMIHEVMVLDHGGVDFGFITYGHFLKMWVLGTLLVELVIPRTGYMVLDLVTSIAGMFGLSVLVGVVESGMARLRMPRVPHLLFGAIALACLALVLEYRR